MRIIAQDNYYYKITMQQGRKYQKGDVFRVFTLLFFGLSLRINTLMFISEYRFCCSEIIFVFPIQIVELSIQIPLKQ